MLKYTRVITINNRYFSDHNQRDQIGWFSKFFAANFLINAAQILGNFLGYSQECNFKIKIYFGYICGQYWKIWVNFYSSIWSH